MNKFPITDLKTPHDVLSLVQSLMLAIVIPFTLWYVANYAPYIQDKPLIDLHMRKSERILGENRQTLRKVRDSLIRLETKLGDLR